MAARLGSSDKAGLNCRGRKDGDMLEKMAPFHSAFLIKVCSETTLFCYHNRPYLYTGVPIKLKPLFLRYLGLKAAKPSGSHACRQASLATPPMR